MAASEAPARKRRKLNEDEDYVPSENDDHIDNGSAYSPSDKENHTNTNRYFEI